MLILLTAANIFLLLMVTNQSGSEIYSGDTAKDITRLLRESGIRVDEEFFFGDSTAMDIIKCSIDEGYAKKAAEKLLPEYNDIFRIPDGYSFFGPENECFTIKNDLNIYLNTIGCSELELNGEPISAREKENALNILSSLLTDKNEENKFGIKLVSAAVNDAVTVAEIVQTFDNTPISNHTLLCGIIDGEAVYLKGNWCFLPIKESFSAHLLDNVNILFIEKNEIESIKKENESISNKVSTKTVKDMEQCYISQISGDGKTLLLMPSVHIDWQEKGVNDTYYNAVSGEKRFFNSVY